MRNFEICVISTICANSGLTCTPPTSDQNTIFFVMSIKEQQNMKNYMNFKAHEQNKATLYHTFLPPRPSLADGNHSLSEEDCPRNGNNCDKDAWGGAVWSGICDCGGYDINCWGNKRDSVDDSGCAENANQDNYGMAKITMIMYHLLPPPDCISYFYQLYQFIFFLYPRPRAAMAEWWLRSPRKRYICSLNPDLVGFLTRSTLASRV